jgi:hypothetical protein
MMRAWYSPHSQTLCGERRVWHEEKFSLDLARVEPTTPDHQVPLGQCLWNSGEKFFGRVIETAVNLAFIKNT